MSKEHRCYAIAFDMAGRSEGDFSDFRRALSALEADFPGTHLLGTDTVDGWPSFVFRPARKVEEP